MSVFDQRFLVEIDHDGHPVDKYRLVDTLTGSHRYYKSEERAQEASEQTLAAEAVIPWASIPAYDFIRISRAGISLWAVDDNGKKLRRSGLLAFFAYNPSENGALHLVQRWLEAMGHPELERHSDRRARLERLDCELTAQTTIAIVPGTRTRPSLLCERAAA